MQKQLELDSVRWLLALQEVQLLATVAQLSHA
jgi:hypothetical protein